MSSSYRNRTVPDLTDPPDAPADFRHMVDSLPFNQVFHDRNNLTNAQPVNPRPGNPLPMLSVNVPAGAGPGSLVLVHSVIRIATNTGGVGATLLLKHGNQELCGVALNSNPEGDWALSGLTVAGGGTRMDCFLDFRFGPTLTLQSRSISVSVVSA